MSHVHTSSSYLPQPQGPVWIAGAGVSGRGAADLATQLGWSVCIIDSNFTAANELADRHGGSAMTVDESTLR